MTLTPEQLYKECRGTLTTLEDPSGAGSQASTYGYLAGGGTDLRQKLDLLNAQQDSTSARPITVNVRPPDKVGPGVISGTIALQALKQSVDLDEDHSMSSKVDIGNPGGAPSQSDSDKWAYVKLAILAGPTDTQFAVTDELQQLILDAVPNNLMPNTRAAMTAALSIPGSRHQEMDGSTATLEQMQAADAWGQANDGAYISLYT